MLRVDTDTAEAGGREPRALWFGARRVVVLAVVDRWYGPDRRWWKVHTAEGEYIVRLDEPSGTWELAAIVGESA